ncbi:hypothetical protein GCM10009563_11090 [Subtercola frigoramans]
MAVLGGFGNLGAITPLIVPGDADATARTISLSPTLFLAGVASFTVVALLDVIVAGAFFTLFRPVNPRLSLTAALLRVGYAVLFLVAISRLVVGYSQLSDPTSALATFQSFTTIWVVSLGLFGLSLLVVGYLAYRSGFIARVFGVLLGIAGLGYLADAIAKAAIPGFTAAFAQFTFVGEVALIFWLLIAGRRLPSNR